MQTIEILLLPYTRWSMFLLLWSCRLPRFWLPLVRYLVFACGVQDFLGDPTNVPYSALVDTCLASVYEAFWKVFTFMDPCILALCLVRQRIHAHASDYGGSRVEATLAVACARLVQRSSADVEDTAELPQLHSLWFPSCVAAHHRVDELTG